MIEYPCNPCADFDCSSASDQDSSYPAADALSSSSGLDQASAAYSGLDLDPAAEARSDPDLDPCHAYDPYYDVIICNPPYFLSSTKPGSRAKAGARHADVSLPFEDLASGVAALLRRRDGSAGRDGAESRDGPAGRRDSSAEGCGTVGQDVSAGRNGTESRDGPAGRDGGPARLRDGGASCFYVVLPTEGAVRFAETAARHALVLVSRGPSSL